ncbi:MAG: KOW motif-containing protein [Bacteroidia bacterium]|nr:KOW motif-containing protein [Bacteroidia bacterium]MDW8235873.1 transcription termination/antitermination NusG family protein [Bacteroidia bacterium]
MPWYALKVRVSQEKKIADLIRSELRRQQIEHQVKDIVVPIERVLRDTPGGKKKEREKVFMPGYLFVEVAAEKYISELYHALRLVPGVMYFVSSTRKAVPTPLPEAEISHILSRARATSSVGEGDQIFEVGQEVRIIEGPFSGLKGYVTEVYPEKQRIQVKIQVFRRETPIEIPYSHAEPI